VGRRHVKHCSNDGCPDLARYGLRGEYLGTVEICPKCGQPLADGPAPVRITETEWIDHVCVGTFSHPTAAHVARARLESEGIPCTIQDENVSGVQWLYSQAIGGTKLCVPRERAEEATRILARDDSALLEGIAEAHLPQAADEVCPRCGESLSEPSRLGFRSRALSLLVGFPFVLWRRFARCGHCGYRWRRGSAAA
jgi:hypothetical protein